MKKKLITIAVMVMTMTSVIGQDTAHSGTLNYDPHKMKIIPDKVFEIGGPLLLLFLLLNTVVSVMKNRAANRLTEKMLEKGISEDTLLKIFKDQHVITKLQPLKWFLFSLATGAGLLSIHLLQDYLVNQSGYLASGIILIFLSIAFLIYFRLVSKRI